MRWRRRGHPRAALRAKSDCRISDFSTKEIRAALRSLGFDNIPKRISKGQIVDWVDLLGVPPKQMARALREVKRSRPREPRPDPRQREGSPGRGGRHRNGGSGVYDKIPMKQLRSVLRMVGVRDAGSYSRQELLEQLHDLGVLPQDMQQLLGRAAVYERPKGRQRGRGASTRTRQARRRPRQSWEDEYQAFAREYYGDDMYDDDEYEVYEVYDEDDEYDDFFDYVLDQQSWGADEEPWEDDDEEANWSRGRGRSDFWSYEAYQQDPSARAPSSGSSARPPPWTAAAFGGGVESDYPFSSAETPDEAMVRALREGWAPQRLSRAQAALLLGVPMLPSLDELRVAKKQHVLRWHPDRNPENAKAGDAFRLVMAAADVLGR